MNPPILLDTCALLFVFGGEPVSAAAEAALQGASADTTRVMISPMSAWEIGMLTSRGRLSLPLEPLAWIQAAVDEGLEWAPMPPEVLVNSSFLPGAPLRDPADRIIAATARAYGYRLMTRDRPLLALGEEGHIQAIRC